MGRVCTVCCHPERASIDASIASGTPYRVISRQHSIGHDAIQRHASSHISQEVKRSQEAREEAQSLDVVKQLQEINTIAFSILRDARKANENELALKAIDRVCKQLELQAKLLGDIDQPQINIWLAPEWVSIRAVISQALVPFPEARIAVASALMQMEGNRDSLN